MENFLTEMERLTLVHESGSMGDYYRVSMGRKSGKKGKTEDKEEEKPAAAKKHEAPKKSEDPTKPQPESANSQSGSSTKKGSPESSDVASTKDKKDE
jgi:H+-transporting ATPase